MQTGINLLLIFLVWNIYNPTYEKTTSNNDCSLHWSKNLPSWFPLIWSNGTIVYPQNFGPGQWEIVVQHKEQLQVSCSDSSNNLKGFGKPSIKITCVNRVFKVGKRNVQFEDLGCEAPITENVVRTGICEDPKLDLVEIQYRFDNNAFPVITVCHNPENDETRMSHNLIQGGALNSFEVSNNRPSFKEGPYYKSVDANAAYSQKSQRAAVAQFTGSAKLVEKYIKSEKSLYLARGHLAPDGDFVHIYEQNATYYFVNVVPQWQSINNGNWKSLETAVRKYATTKNLTLHIWSGTKGVMKLDDLAGKPVEIYLAKDKTGKWRIPVPELTWKVVFEPKSKSAVVVFIVNNPHLKTIPNELKVCNDICSDIGWVNWKLENILKGHTYCCSYKDAKPHLIGVPNLGNVDLLV